jgi:hypothetical protein
MLFTWHSHLTSYPIFMWQSYLGELVYMLKFEKYCYKARKPALSLVWARIIWRWLWRSYSYPHHLTELQPPGQRVQESSFWYTLDGFDATVSFFFFFLQTLVFPQLLCGALPKYALGLTPQHPQCCDYSCALPYVVKTAFLYASSHTKEH